MSTSTRRIKPHQLAIGLGVLVGGLKRVRAHNGSLAVVCTQERLLKIFRITGLTKVFSIRESVDAALTAN